MGRFRLRKHVVEASRLDDGFVSSPAGFNFTRDVVEAAAAADGLRPAMTFVDREGIIDRRTFREVANDASRWTSYFRSLHLAPGDRVLVFVGKTPVWHSLMLGALKAGLVAVPCSEMLRARDIDFRVVHSGARLVVTDRARAPELEGLQATVDVRVVEDLKVELRTHSVSEATHDTAADDAAFILYTSGTTKDPKGVVHSHAYTWANRFQAEHWLMAVPGDLVWCTAGTGWAKSIWNVLLGPWSCGAEVVLHEGSFEADERFDLIQRLGVTVLCQAPTEYRLMAKQPSLERFYLGSVRHAVSAGEPLNPEVIDAFRVAFGLTIYDGYGQTENTLLVANVPGVEVKPGSMGLPAPGFDISVIDEDGNEQPAGVEGEIALHGRPLSLFLEYWNAPAETEAAFRGEWYLTGDRGTRDEDGYLWFTGRADDVILSSAYRIGPFEVESALLEHPSVQESAVVGKPDVDRGSIVKAFVVLRDGFEPSDELAVELQGHVKSVTAPYKYPREIEFVAELPKTASGKIRRVVLRDQELAAAGMVAPPARLLDAEAEPVALAPETVAVDPEPELVTLAEVAVDAAPEETSLAAAAALAASEREAADRLAAQEQAAERSRRDEAESKRAKEAEAEAREQERQRGLDVKRGAEAARAADQQARRNEADAKRAAKIEAKAEAQQRMADEKRRREEEKAAAEQARRDAAEASRATKIQAKADAQQRKADEKRRRAEEKAAKEKARRDAADEKRAAQAAAAEAARHAKDAELSAAPAPRPRVPDPAIPDPGDATEETEHISADLIARLRAYGHGDSDEDAVKDEE